MNPRLIIAIVGSGVFLTAACTPPSGAGAEPQPPVQSAPPSPVPSTVDAKPSYARAQQLSDQVKVGMPQSTVEAMFGRPDKAGYQVLGRATGTPWRALVWEWLFQDVDPSKVLSITFQEVNGKWLVNHGDWP